jgi:hypothetical protein
MKKNDLLTQQGSFSPNSLKSLSLVVEEAGKKGLRQPNRPSERVNDCICSFPATCFLRLTDTKRTIFQLIHSFSVSGATADVEPTFGPAFGELPG